VIEYKENSGMVLDSSWWHGFVVGVCCGFILCVIVVVILSIIGMI